MANSVGPHREPVEGRKAIDPAKPPLIRLDNVSKSFGALRVIDGLSLALP